jgi:hypothetical protein
MEEHELDDKLKKIVESGDFLFRLFGGNFFYVPRNSSYYNVWKFHSKLKSKEEWADLGFDVFNKDYFNEEMGVCYDFMPISRQWLELEKNEENKNSCEELEYQLNMRYLNDEQLIDYLRFYADSCTLDSDFNKLQYLKIHEHFNNVIKNLSILAEFENCTNFGELMDIDFLPSEMIIKYKNELDVFIKDVLELYLKNKEEKILKFVAYKTREKNLLILKDEVFQFINEWNCLEKEQIIRETTDFLDDLESKMILL